MKCAPPTPDGAPVAVLGAGPAGLTAAYTLAARGLPVVVLEADDTVGGLSRTVVADGYRFDLGGHRFFTKSAEVEALWSEVLGPEMLVRPRLSRIYWRGRFVQYPLRAGDVIARVGPLELSRCAASYARARLRRGGGREESFEDWVTARFGRRLFELFFKTYTEKVWGVRTDELRAEWAAQRIADLSLWRAARAAVPGRRRGVQPKSLIEEFRYPRLGPGQMWEEMARRIAAGGGEVRLGARVEGLRLDGDRVATVTAGGEELEVSAAISSIPLRTVAGIGAPSAAVREAAAGLRYRDFLTVALVIDGEPPFPDNWIYVHDPGARVGRIQNFRAWSPWMTPDPRRSCVGLEYFCFEGDELWRRDDADLVALARSEMDELGLVPADRVVDGHVVRVPKAYPIYDAEYADRVARIRDWLDAIANLQQIGRNGLHRYNNSDHSMLTAMRAVENLCDGAGHDIWAVNADSVYHERDEAPEQPYRVVPETPTTLARASD